MSSFVSIPPYRNHFHVSVNCSVSSGVNTTDNGDPNIAGIGFAVLTSIIDIFQQVTKPWEWKRTYSEDDQQVFTGAVNNSATSTFIESIKDAHAFFVGTIGHSVLDNKIEACNFYVLALLFYGVATIVETFSTSGESAIYRLLHLRAALNHLGELHKSNATAAEYHHNSEEFSRGSGASARPGLDHQPSWASITAKTRTPTPTSSSFAHARE
ncbi:hypothetical protein F4809DRAFT_641301 [Biscogniauxia mediterranea]|nr:hypothetical protein F4809DRAFT_641301 [Biscogniauxia mediterranea]